MRYIKTPSYPILTLIFVSVAKGTLSLLEQEHQPKSTLDIDLTALIFQPTPKEKPHSFSHALTLIESLQKAPSCNRLATATLIDSCQTLEQADRDHNNALDWIKSIFAARLAVCELQSANVHVPPECRALIPQHRQLGLGGNLRCFLPGAKCSKRTFASSHTNDYAVEYVDTTRPKVSQCLTMLESRPQWWTSYSNARQNAISICHAARAEVDKDEILATHTSILTLFSDLSKSLQEYETERTESQHNTTTLLRDLQAQLFRELDEAKETFVTTFFTTLTHKLTSLTTLTFTALRNLTTETNKLTSKLQHTSTAVSTTDQSLASLLQKAQVQHTSLAESATTQANLATSISSTLSSIQGEQLTAIFAALVALHDNLTITQQHTYAATSLQQAQLDNTTLQLAHLQSNIASSNADFAVLDSKLTALSQLLDRHIHTFTSFGSNKISTLLLLLAVGVVAKLSPGAAVAFAAAAGAMAVLVGVDWNAAVAWVGTFMGGYWPVVLPVGAMGVGLCWWYSRRYRP